MTGFGENIIPLRKENNMAKNLCGKIRPVDKPYEIWTVGEWEWRVLKKWQADDNKPYGRYFCAVKSPYTRLL
jgi:hypothetical protein